ncbi:MAG: hypothetical protein A2X08_09285 [Bacteroidetes bacterium GWA2_32_17]|nr:MAG: hypothetical protein A2X08_09285 [Bacteroidetes bacterium GWA2_32_17]
MKKFLFLFFIWQTPLLFAQNLVQNFGFENGINPWIIFSSSGSATIFSFDNSEYHSGTTSLLMLNTPADSSYLAQIVPVVAGHRYLCDFWVKADSMEHYMLPFVKFRNDTLSVYDTYFCPNGNTQDWQRIVSRIIVPDNADNMVFFFALFGKGNFRIDDISLVEITDTTYNSFTVQADQFNGSFKKLFSANGIGPGNQLQPFNHIQKFQELGVDYMRTHDFQTAFDHSVIFPDTTADPMNPTAYNFHTTDSCIADIINAGGKVYFRFGQSYDPTHTHNNPPLNMEKWAQVCVQIIKHFNDGWNNGFNYNISDFEIWNEPDITDFWTGTAEDYIRLYRITSTKIKSYNPLLKVGGPVVSNVYNESFINSFIDSVSTYNLPLDFFVYHLYYLYNPYYFKVVNEYVRNKLDSAGLTNIELINSEWNSYMVSFETYNEWGMDDPLNAASAAGALVYMQESTIGKFFRYAFDNYWFGMVNWYDQWRYSGLSMRALRQLMDNGQKLFVSGGDTLGTVIIASGSPSNDEMQLVVADNSSTANGYTIHIQGLDPTYVYPYQIYRIDATHKYFLVETGTVSQISADITIPVKSPFTDHVIFDCLVSSSNLSLSNNLIIYPNPCYKSFSFAGKMNYNEYLNVELSDVSGRIIRVWEINMRHQNNIFSVEGISPSVYFVKINNADGKQIVFKLAIN